MRNLWLFGVFALLAAGAALFWVQSLESEEPVVLTAVAGPRGSDSFRLLQEISEVAERHSETVRLDVRPSRDSSVNISMIQRGEVDLGTISSNTPAVPKVQLLANLFPDYFLIIARESSQIRTIQDLRGKRIALPQGGSPQLKAFWSIIDHYDMAIDSVKGSSVSRERAMEMFINNEVEAAFFVNSIRDPFLLGFIEEAGIRRVGMRIVPIRQAKAMSLKRPFLAPETIVRGAFTGNPPLPREDTQTTSLQRLLVANQETDPDAIRELTRVIFENRLDLLIRMPLTSAILSPQTGSGASLPLHPGAASYYDRDKPSFLQENAEPMALIVTVFAMLASAGLAIRRNMQARAKNRGDVYNDVLLDIGKRARASSDVSELKAMKDELTELLEKVVHALDRDQVTEEGFQSFSFLWKATKDTVDERLTDQKS